MNDESLAKVMAALEKEVGAERLSALRRAAARKGVTVIKLLGDAVSSFADKINAASHSKSI